MKIYLTASISQRDYLSDYYKRIIKTCEKQGYKVYSGNLFKYESYREELQSQADRMEWYKNSLRAITSADIVIVEISYPSTANVGHELSVALEKGKPVIALYKEDKNPVFLQGKADERLFLVPYTDDDIEDVLTDALKDASDQMDVRFNFFVSPKIVRFLDWIAKKKKMPRAVYLRRLIDQDMQKNKEFVKSET